jgi:DNA-directed RNA polymerase, mitochondrial
MLFETAPFTQEQAETLMVDEGRARFHAQNAKARSQENESNTKYGQYLLSSTIIPFRDGIREWLDNVEQKKSGRRHAVYPYIKELGPDVVAFLVSRAVIDCIGAEKSYASTITRVGRILEDERRFMFLKEKHPGLWRKLDRQLSTKGNYSHKRTIIMLAMNRGGIVYPKWPEKDCANLGAVTIDILREKTGLCEIETHQLGKRERLTTIRATAQTIEWIKGFNAYNEDLAPMFLPSVEVPPKWECPYFGGYRSKDVLEVEIVKHATRAQLDRLAEKPMSDVYDTLNALQSTPWRVNTRVLAVVNELKDSPVSIGSLPSAVPEPLPPKPADIDTNEEARKAWRSAAAPVHERNAATNSKRIATAKMRWVANHYAQHERIYFPYQLDFRGRIYALPNFLNPQGSDLAKSLIHFAEGVGMLDEGDAEWLKITGANLFGVDKVSFEDRKAWVDANKANILAVAADPLNCLWWQKADGGENAWCFLAWCFEWAGWLQTGRGYLTHLPCAIDGTNNGLQILALLTRDEAAAKATNVTPSEHPQDIYGDVAKEAIKLMHADASDEREKEPDYRIPWEKIAYELSDKEAIPPVVLTEDDVREIFEGKQNASDALKEAVTRLAAEYRYKPQRRSVMASYWLSFGIDRKTTKRPVMVLPYGGTFKSCQDYIMDWYREVCAKRNIQIPRDRVAFDRCRYLANRVWKGIDFCVDRPRRAMEWLQSLATLLNEVNKPIVWETPVGFLVEQKYAEENLIRVETTLGDGITPVRAQLNLSVENPRKLNKRAQRNGISPNYVHSLDASALCRTVANALKCGVTSFSMIHDSYGTHSPKMHQLAAACRHAFAELFTPDLLSKLRDEIIAALPPETEVPPVPDFGSLDVRSVRDSEFFFA